MVWSLMENLRLVNADGDYDDSHLVVQLHQQYKRLEKIYKIQNWFCLVHILWNIEQYFYLNNTKDSNYFN